MLHNSLKPHRIQSNRLLGALVATLILLSACTAPTANKDPLLLTATATPPTTATQGEPYAGFTVEASGGIPPTPSASKVLGPKE